MLICDIMLYNDVFTYAKIVLIMCKTIYDINISYNGSVFKLKCYINEMNHCIIIQSCDKYILLFILVINDGQVTMDYAVPSQCSTCKG